MSKFEDIAERFWKMEREERLLDYDLNGVLIWKLIRIYVFEKLVQKITKTEIGHPNLKCGLKKRLYEKVLIFNLLCTKNAFFNKKSVKYLVFRHRRRINVDGKNIEVNTEFIENIIDDINKDNTEFIETGIAFENRNIEQKAQFLLVNPIRNIVAYYFCKVSYRFRNEYKAIDRINKIIFSYFGIHLDITDMALKNRIGFKNMYNIFYKYILLKKPQGIYLVCSYGKEALIKAAFDLNVPVYEIQHGVISKYHMGYSFPGVGNVPYFPDKILVYGDYWRTAAEYPIDIENIIATGSPYFEMQLKKYADISSEKKSIMFISAGDIGKAMSVIASDFADMKTDYKVYYKLHPSEFSVWKEIYPALTGKQRDNLIVIEDEINLYELFARSSYVIGVNSTAIFESFVFEPKLILFNRPGVEFMSELVKNYKIPIVNNAEELITIVSNYPVMKKIKRDYFYKNISKII